MRNWRASLGFIALVTVGAALLLPVPSRLPVLRIAAQAQGAPKHASEQYRGMINVEDKHVPLPQGDWQLAGRAANAADAGHRVVSVALVRLHGADVDAAVLIQTNARDTAASWGNATACDRTDLYFARIRYASDHDGSCAYAAYVEASVNRQTTDPAWQQALLHGAGSDWRFPTHWLEAAYRITDPRDAIQVRYLFHSASGTDPATVRALVAWTEASWQQVGSGFRNRHGVEDGLPDWRQSVATPQMLPQVGENGDHVEHIGAKMITYRIFGTMTDMSVNYLWLGSLPSAGGLAIVSAVASSALYFVHELAWSRFESPPVLVGDLPGVGVEGPGPSTP
jgi:uncharacterized membrane protein